MGPYDKHPLIRKRNGKPLGRLLFLLLMRAMLLPDQAFSDQVMGKIVSFKGNVEFF